MSLIPATGIAIPITTLANHEQKDFKTQSSTTSILIEKKICGLCKQQIDGIDKTVNVMCCNQFVHMKCYPRITFKDRYPTSCPVNCHLSGKSPSLFDKMRQKLEEQREKHDKNWTHLCINLDEILIRQEPLDDAFDCYLKISTKEAQDNSLPRFLATDFKDRQDDFKTSFNKTSLVASTHMDAYKEVESFINNSARPKKSSKLTSFSSCPRAHTRRRISTINLGNVFFGFLGES